MVKKKKQKYRIKVKSTKLENRRDDSKGFLVALIILIVLLGIGLYYQFFNYQTVNNKQSFLNAMYNCNRAVYNTGQWYYKIKGLSRKECVVYVKNLRFNEASVDVVSNIEGKDMLCYLGKDRGTYMPEEKLDKCHGLLKEAIQDATIRKLQLYIMQNLKSLK